jgi:hypothetical protein
MTFPIASGYTPNIGANGTGSTAVNLNIGDPVQLLSSTVNTATAGTVRLAPAGVNADATFPAEAIDRVFGIVMGFPRVRIAGAQRPNGFYTSGTTYTGGIGGQEATLCKVLPVANCIFEVDVSTTGAGFDERGEFMAAVGQQVNFHYPSVLTSGIGQPKANPMINFATLSLANLLQLTIVGIGRVDEAQDFASAFVRLQVRFNTEQLQAGLPSPLA